MTRYIDADALKELWQPDHNRKFDADYFIHTIDNAPTADVVEVVQCKDCKHRNHCNETVAHTKEHDGFREHWSESIEWCSRGERKEESEVEE